jgi:hypothetical protein
VFNPILGNEIQISFRGYFGQFWLDELHFFVTQRDQFHEYSWKCHTYVCRSCFLVCLVFQHQNNRNDFILKLSWSNFEPGFSDGSNFWCIKSSNNFETSGHLNRNALKFFRIKIYSKILTFLSFIFYFTVICNSWLLNFYAIYWFRIFAMMGIS